MASTLRGAKRGRRWILRSVPIAVLGIFAYLYHVIGYEYYVRHVLATHPWPQHLRTWCFVLFLHLMFFYCVSLHIQITMARPKYVDTISYTQTWSPMPRHQYWLPLYPLRILTAKPRDEDSADLQHMIHERAASGEPQRCWRDRCRGHWKAPRMRHCGECGECRFFFDHHCLWFNNDITAPHTLVPFLLLISLTPCLFVLACWPLLPLAWHHIVLLWEHSTSHPWIVQHFWDKKWTWVLGPIHRPLLGLYLASRYPPSSWGQRSLFDTTAPQPTFRLPFCIMLGAFLALITLGLAITTIRHLIHGQLTVEAERTRSWKKWNQPGSLVSMEKKESVRPAYQFWVPHKQCIIYHPTDEALFNRGWLTNLSGYMGISTANPFAWPHSLVQDLIS
ncbi:protein-cysteine S-palmitoyltransferase [Malassezia pachydermatis]